MSAPRLVPRLLTTLALLALAVLGLAGPASAHDQVVTTSPGDGASVGTPPGSVSVTMSEEPNAVGTQIRVTSADTRARQLVSTGAVRIDGAVITQPLDAQKVTPGAYTVAYRVTSADGHPISGSFRFTVAGAPNPTNGGAVEPNATADSSASAGQSSRADADQPDPALNNQTPMIPIVLGVVAVLLLGGLAALVIAHRHPPRRMD